MKEKKTEGLEAKIAELTQDLQRTRADFENFRKQVENQKENEKRATKLATVYKFLPLLDDLDRAIAAYQELDPLAKSLTKVLTSLDLEKIDSREGVEFNPDLFEAVMVEGEGEKEVVAETLRPGYFYNQEVLRPAMVKVKRVGDEEVGDEEVGDEETSDKVQG
ncbi:nucleotide exchange factor GrpE [Candidatus Saccharibacteria bacterium]|nr:nucleotide exchange factor GrpE [Candidatus Saccharibacteria bacterium]